MLENEVLFIQGVQKTGTSTLVGILNCHPNIFMLYETAMYRGMISKYGHQLLSEYPEARALFRYYIDVGIPYSGLGRFLSYRTGNRYKYIGDKIISVNPDFTQKVNKYKTIFLMRDLRTWLCKESVVKYYRTDLDVVPAAIDFTKYVIGIHKYPDCLKVKMEEMVENNVSLLYSLNKYLDLDIASYADVWYDKIGKYNDNDPKKSIKWYSGHKSSKVKPKELDTKIELTLQRNIRTT